MDEEEKKQYLKDLNRISMKVYKKEYHYICSDRKIIIKKLYLTGDF